MKSYLRTRALSIMLLLAGSVSAWAGQNPQAKPQSAPAKSTQAAKKTDPDEVIPPRAPGALFPAVVARVNGKPVLGRDLEQRIRAELVPIGNPAWKDLREDYRRELIGTSLTSLVGAELIYQKAVESGIKATPAEVQAEFDRRAQTFSSDAEINVMLANRGLDRAGFMKELERALVVSRYINQNIDKKIVVTPAEVSSYYSSHTEEFRHPDLIRTSHILILVPDGATAGQQEMARRRIEAILERVNKGEDFAKLAKENSMDPSASEGGDIGLTQKGQLDPQYEAVAFGLNVGEVSDIIRTQFGFHIIKLTDRKPAGLAPLDEVRDQLTEFLKSQKAEEELQKFVATLRSEAKIEVLIQPDR